MSKDQKATYDPNDEQYLSSSRKRFSKVYYLCKLVQEKKLNLYYSNVKNKRNSGNWCLFLPCFVEKTDL